MKDDVIWIKEEPSLEPRPRDEELQEKALEIRVFAQAIRDMLSHQQDAVYELQRMVKRRKVR